MYAKDPYEWKYQYLIKNCEELGLKHFQNPKSLIGYSNDIKKCLQKYWRLQSRKGTESIVHVTIILSGTKGCKTL